MVGIDAPMAWNQETSKGAVVGKYQRTAIGPFVRYYQPFTDKFFGIVHGGYQLTFEKSTDGVVFIDPVGGDPTDVVNSKSIVLGVGLCLLHKQSRRC